MFVNETEEKFADILDYLGLDWEYEPTVFVILEQNGAIKKALRPDFYLPQLDLYIEISISNNRRRKRRKVEQALAKHPEANIFLLLDDNLKKLFTEYKFLWNK